MQTVLTFLLILSCSDNDLTYVILFLYPCQRSGGPLFLLSVSVSFYMRLSQFYSLQKLSWKGRRQETGVEQSGSLQIFPGVHIKSQCKLFSFATLSVLEYLCP